MTSKNKHIAKTAFSVTRDIGRSPQFDTRLLLRISQKIHSPQYFYQKPTPATKG